MDEQQRGLQLCAQGLRRLGIFEHADWWDHLPVDGLSSRDVDRIEISANFQLALLSTFLGQGLASVDTVALRALGLPLKHTEQRDRQFMLAYRTADMALAYRPSQWTSHLKEIGRYMQSSRSTMPTRPQWRGDNYIDAVIFGQMSLMLSYSGEGGIARAFMDQIFGLAGTAIEARRYAVRSTELDPLNSNARTSLGWIEHRIGNYDAARNNFTNAIALRPDLVVNYVLRSNTLLSQSMNTDDAVERRRLQYLALDDAIIARELAPDREMVHWASGNALRQLGKHSQAVASYLAAIDREPPVDMVPLSKFQFLLQGRDPKRVRRLSYWLADRFDAVQTYVRQLQMDEPDNSQFMLLQAAVALELQEYEDARMAAERMLEISEQDPNLASSIVGHAHAIIGETHRHKQQWQQAKDAFARSSQNDPINSLATVGLAAMLEQLATATKDAVDFELALAAYDKLARIAFTDWQSVRAQAGRFRILVDLDRMDEASIAVNLLLDADRGYDLSPLLEFAEDRDAAPVLEKLRSLRIDVQLEQAVADQQPARTLPLRNGHFELGLSAYWEPWSTEGQCLAETTIDDTSPRPDSNGVASLLIQHESAATPGARGVLEQTLPAMPDKRFRVSLWAKSRQSTAGGTQIVVDDAWDVPTIELPGGSYDWQEFSGEFIATAKSNYADQPGLTKIKIVSTAPGEVWIDDIRIEQVVE
jgi:tetratricopeptide (TPR) repeat protein